MAPLHFANKDAQTPKGIFSYDWLRNWRHIMNSTMAPDETHD